MRARAGKPPRGCAFLFCAGKGRRRDCPLADRVRTPRPHLPWHGNEGLALATSACAITPPYAGIPPRTCGTLARISRNVPCACAARTPLRRYRRSARTGCRTPWRCRWRAPSRRPPPGRPPRNRCPAQCSAPASSGPAPEGTMPRNDCTQPRTRSTPECTKQRIGVAWFSTPGSESRGAAAPAAHTPRAPARWLLPQLLEAARLGQLHSHVQQRGGSLRLLPAGAGLAADCGPAKRILCGLSPWAVTSCAQSRRALRAGPTSPRGGLDPGHRELDQALVHQLRPCLLPW